MYGRNSDGFYQNSTGIIFKTTDPDHYGDMKVQLNVVEADTMEPAKVTVETSGWVHMLKEYPGFKFRWNPAPGDDLFDINSFGYVHTSIPAITSAHHPDGTKSNTGRQYIEGAADRNGMNLYYFAPSVSLDGEDTGLIFKLKLIG
ncbi:hypothetical protein FOZ60_007868 [Perkinsus olseni]|uniref:Uncharacterized protein n=1 Tax=Perkinsus olseni TaxID=32597 RepID=A0A7J6NLP9_PEROL|nr:hypothetical protein FOZ60_007868 [Perkinsus olseni]